ncbi:bilirubin oxidase [Mucilaginibacter gracilis]|uniref:Bilirubin oxidase n=1 Tax=Mucilaginibacter gracilis TaxID=423350 RepID=A0A495J6R0_9SPHI|nr:multicopper oxidase domain-containing protein [Mucilaginibacter gracilis]RKR84567.1 bilirubin oxidase [Mucilaginibacter gracilis]
MKKLLFAIVLLGAVIIYSCNKSSGGSGSTGGTTNTTSTTYNALYIPPTLTGTSFNISLAKSSKQFFATGADTPTYSYNGLPFWGPTLIFNKGDNITLNVTNNLTDTTTVHWHGFHIPPIMDGGPHQKIAPGTTWSPHFVVMNSASTYWFHPHLHEKTYQQLTMGAGGLIIVRDPIETALNLPRNYGVDDIPLVLTSRRFNADNSFNTNVNDYGDYLLANGTLNPQATLPKQFVRFRILNAEIERAYNLGFGDNRTFYVISNDGGLLDAPAPVTRLVLGVGERAEVLVDLSNDAVGSNVSFKSYNSGQTFGFPGGEPSTSGALGSLLNNTTFEVLNINVAAATSGAVTAIPTKLTTNTYLAASDATSTIVTNITAGQGSSEFAFDNNNYNYITINHTIPLNTVVKWTFVNSNVFGHSIHIHDIQFKIVSRSSGTIQPYEQGWKDSFFLHLGETVSVVAKFNDFADGTNPYMYHCHFPNHEDAGLMGQFLVTP